jgi:hypothetical protein
VLEGGWGCWQALVESSYYLFCLRNVARFMAKLHDFLLQAKLIKPTLNHIRRYFKSLRTKQPQNTFCVGTDGGPLFLHPGLLKRFLVHIRRKSSCNFWKIDVGSLIKRRWKNLGLDINRLTIGLYLSLTTLEQELEGVKGCYLHVVLLLQVRSKRVTYGCVLDASSLSANLGLGQLCARLQSTRSNLRHGLLLHY